MLTRVIKKGLNNAVAGNDRPCGKSGEKGTEEREVFKHHYKEIKWTLMKDLWKLVSIFHHTNSGESTVYSEISSTMLMFV